MYGVVLATVMTVGASTPAWGWHGHGCYGCYGCHGCYGCSGYAFSSCYGCYGGSYGCYGSCYGCYGGCYGCYGCYGGCYGCYGCYGGCYGATVYYAAAPVYSAGPSSAESEIRRLREELESLRKKQQPKMDKETPPSPAAAPAQLTIKLPAEAKMYVDGVVCPLTSSTRSFATRPLQPGQQFYYTIRADLTRDGTQLTQSQKVIVEAGREVMVEFNKLAPATATTQR
jgi:uncharacterized protein (TIGR03000 family)